MSRFLQRLGKEILFFDGAIGTCLQALGLQANEGSESWNLTHAQELISLHQQYLQAGCSIITANTFGANPLKVGGAAEPLLAAAMQNARQAIVQSGKDALLALDIGPCGKLLAPAGEVSFDAAYNAFAQMVRAGAPQADLILIETMTDLYELKAAVLAAKENSTLPVVACFSPDKDGRLLTGADITCCVATLEGLRVDAIGLNCGFGPDSMLPLFSLLQQQASVPLLVMPNAGLPELRDEKPHYTMSPQQFAHSIQQIAKSGIALLGGCCGTTPAHMQAAIAACRGIPAQVPPQKNKTIVCGTAKSCTIGNAPVLIGERLNPTGKKRLQQALRENDMGYLVKEGFGQQALGVPILDLNVGLSDIDEGAAMLAAMQQLQAHIPLPLQLDSADPAVLETAMRYYHGKPMVNSVSGKVASMQAVFPLVQKYGGVLVALTLDEHGIPDTAAGRIKIAEKIHEKAKEYNINHGDIVFDALTMTIGTNEAAARVTLETVRRLREELGVNTILGVSNVSYGLPQRETLNAAFLTQALQSGLSAAIINPASESMQTAYRASLALLGYDASCAAYIASASGENKSKPAAQEALTLQQAILDGLADAAFAAAKQQLQTLDAQTLLQQQLIPALDTVGERYANGAIFLPQMLKSADAAQAASRALQEHLQGGEQQGPQETVLLATVHGDIHDIGKNIVKIMLESYRYRVVDLGKDVPAQAVVDAVKMQGIRLVGLSALMTTTIPAMQETIRLLHSSGCGCKVMVGGAVLTAQTAEAIGADYYAADAMQGVKIANTLFRE